MLIRAKTIPINRDCFSLQNNLLISAILNYDCLMFKTLKKKDRILSSLAEKEVKRQKNSIDLIASENIAPQGVLELLGSELTNKYSEGYPGKRYYPGNVYYDQIEELAKKRALKIFR